VKVLAAAMGNCVHVAGVQAFLELARANGYETVFLGPAVPVRHLVKAVEEQSPDIVAVSYRLSPESAKALFEELKAQVTGSPSLSRKRYLFGGTPPVARLARETGIFEAAFDGTEPQDVVVAALKGTAIHRSVHVPSSDLVKRIEGSYPMPLFRHHFGLSTLKDTIDGARKIASSGCLDVLSLAPDQNAQESFFRPEEMSSGMAGAGGVPIRTPEDLRTIYEATRTGNHPLVRCYSGTRDLLRWGRMLKDTVNVAWGAVPLTWYSELDGRSKRPLLEAIRENQEAIKWYAENGIAVEVNESHQWALRGSGDTVEVAAAYIAAYNARALGAGAYVCQFMFDTPKGISPSMDLAKMFAKLELVESLVNGRFKVIRMVRSGLSSLSPLASEAKGQLAASVYTALALRPHIVHVVGFSEADHAATADEVIESCTIAKGAVKKAMLGMPELIADPAIAQRKAQLVREGTQLVDAVKRVGLRHAKDPLISPQTLASAVRLGLLDAQDLKGSPVARGMITTRVVNGACVTVDKNIGTVIPEEERLKALAISEMDLDMAEI
jgi:hypothetical protein